MPFGDAALLVRWEERIDPRINAQVHGLAEALRGSRASGEPWAAPVPGYASVLAPFDPVRMDMVGAQAALGALVAALPGRQAASGVPDEASTEPPLEIPVRYGGDYGPDLEAVADHAGLTPAEVVALHSGATYRAYLLGFAPGFAYLGTVAPQLEMPRRATPRMRVPAGSVAIAGRQTAVYPLAAPGGWHLLGRTSLTMWDAERDPPALVTAGRSIRFVALVA